MEMRTARCVRTFAAWCPMRQVLASSYRVPMCSEVEDLSDQRLAEWLLGAESSARADAWARLVDAFGWGEASRRWLAAFAASDAAET